MLAGGRGPGRVLVRGGGADCDLGASGTSGLRPQQGLERGDHGGIESSVPDPLAQLGGGDGVRAEPMMVQVPAVGLDGHHDAGRHFDPDAQQSPQCGGLPSRRLGAGIAQVVEHQRSAPGAGAAARPTRCELSPTKCTSGGPSSYSMTVSAAFGIPARDIQLSGGAPSASRTIHAME